MPVLNSGSRTWRCNLLLPLLVLLCCLATKWRRADATFLHSPASEAACKVWDAKQHLLTGEAQRWQPLHWRHGPSFPTHHSKWGSEFNLTIHHNPNLTLQTRTVIHSPETAAPVYLTETPPTPCTAVSRASPRPVKVPFAHPLKGHFFRDQFGHPYFELKEGSDSCKPQPQLRRLTSAAARSCLAGKKIAWAGDSVTRYQFLSFANFLSSGFYHHPYDDPVIGHSITNEKQWPGWNSFYNGSVSIIGSNSGCANISCDCVREGKDWWAAMYESHESWTAVIPVNPLRTLAAATGAGGGGHDSNDSGDSSDSDDSSDNGDSRDSSAETGGGGGGVSSKQRRRHLAGSISSKHGGKKAAAAARRRVAAADAREQETTGGDTAAAADMSAADAASQSLVQMRMQLVYGHPTFREAGLGVLRRLLTPPANESASLTGPWDYLIFNMAHWGGGATPNPRSASLLSALTEFFKLGRAIAPPSTKLIYKVRNEVSRPKGFPITQDNMAAYAEYAKAATDNGWLVYDINAISVAGIQQGMELHRDKKLHPYGYIYEQWNDLLLSQICD